MKLIRALARRSLQELTRMAALLTIAGLAIMAYSIISPRPLVVILAMTVGQVMVVTALLLYVAAVVFDVSRGSKQSTNPDEPE